MKTIILKIGIVSFLLLSVVTYSQDFQGKAYYQTKRKVDLKLENSKMSDSQQQMMQEMLKKQFERTYILTFNKETSTYKEEEKLETPSATNSGMKMVFIGGGGSGATYYKNIKTKSYIDQQDMFGKQFLIKDSLEELEWKLEDDSKIIGKYLCFKATALREVNRMEMSFSSDSDEEGLKETSENQLIVAWYTTDIPVSNGPAEFGGLPGLILELNADETQYVCTKIVMNTSENILEPTKGKVVNQEEYQKIMEKKMKEMRELYGGRKGKGDKGSFSIRIGG